MEGSLRPLSSRSRELFDSAGWRRWRRPLMIWVPVLVLVLIGLATSFYTVEPEGRAVVKRFGKVVGIRDPGLHFKLPFGIETAQFVPTERVLKEEFGFRTVEPGQRTRYAQQDFSDESLMLTGDLNVIDVEWVVQYRIREPEKYLHEVHDRSGTIRDVSESVMRRVVGNRLGSDVLTVGRVAIAAEVQEEMQQVLDRYNLGIHVAGVELQDVTPPDPVKPAFNEVNQARQDKERLVNIAEKERNQIIPKARGQAEQTIAEAEAYRAERVNVAKGDSSRFTSVLARYRDAPDITRKRLFLETIDSLAGGLNGLYVIDKAASPPLPLFPLGGAPAGLPIPGARGQGSGSPEAGSRSGASRTGGGR